MAVACFAIVMIFGRHAKAVHTAAVLTPDPDPPIAPPAAKEFVHPAAEELPGSSDLAKSLEALLAAAAKISDPSDTFTGSGRAKRWDIRFPSGITAETYSRLLDGLRIELGLIGGGEKISYVSGFLKGKPDVREGPAAAERRFYMTWRSGALRDLDSTMLARAGVTAGDRVVAQFYPIETETKLADLEQEFAGKHTLAEIRRTVFGLNGADKDVSVFRRRAGVRIG